MLLKSKLLLEFLAFFAVTAPVKNVGAWLGAQATHTKDDEFAVKVVADPAQY